MTEEAEQLLDLLSEILREARTGSTVGPGQVVPVLLSEPARFRAVLGEAFRFAGAVVREAESDVDGLEVPEHMALHGQLADTIRAMTVSIAGAPPENITVDQSSANILTVRFGSRPSPSNPGDRNQLGFLTALLDPSILRQKLAVILYDETQMASDGQKRIWRLLEALPTLLADAMPRTLVVVVGAARLDFSRHLGLGLGVRWVIRPSGVSRRRTWERDLTDIARLAQGADPLFFMLGAGVSASSGLPLGNDLRDDALYNLLPQYADGVTMPEDVARAFFRQVRDGRLLPEEVGMSEDAFVEGLTLERVLREEMRGRSIDNLPPVLEEFFTKQAAACLAPGNAITHLRKLLSLRSRVVLFTVNFDQLIESGATVLRGVEHESAVPASGEPPNIRLFVTGEELEAFPGYLADYLANGGAVPLVKIHGSIEQPATVCATVDVTQSGLSAAAAATLRALLGGEGTLRKMTYVGCSMRDIDVSQVIVDPQFSRQLEEHWVAPTPDPNIIRFIESTRYQQWKSRDAETRIGGRLITTTADVFFKTLTERLIP